MDYQLKGKVCTVTGGSKGIGFAIAYAMASEGCSLRLIARDQDALERAREKILQDFQVEVITSSANLSDPKSVDMIGSRFPETDILVNSAGAIGRGNILSLDIDAFRDAWEGKVMSTIMLSRAMYAHMCHRQSGTIINIIGIAGERLNPNSIGTTTANAALMAFTKTLGAESVDHNIRVNGINPGLILTDRTATLVSPRNETDRKVYENLMQRLPYGRMGTAAEVANVAVFLASDLARYVSGEVIAVDAGSRYRY